STSRTAAPPQPAATQGRGVRPGAGFAGMGPPPQKAMNFGPSAKRLFTRFGTNRAGVALVIALAIISAVLNVLGPRILGRGTDLIFSGVIGAQLPAEVSKAGAVAALRAQGENTRADMLAGMD